MNTQTTPDQNALARELNNALMAAAEKFAESHPQTSRGIILGAACGYLATWLSIAPSKPQALKNMEKCFQIIRYAINQAPEDVFGGPTPDPN